jgi:hypothetical protein
MFTNYNNNNQAIFSSTISYCKHQPQIIINKNKLIYTHIFKKKRKKEREREQS